jgi:hypothetical protein
MQPVIPRTGRATGMSRAETLDLNPYSAPQHDAPLLWPLLPPQRWAEVQLRVVNVVRRGLTRRIAISGTTEAEIYYYPAAMDTVCVNGQVRGRASLWDTSLVSPVIEFTIDGPGYRLPARVDAVAGWSWLTIFRLKSFAVTIAGRIVYQE